MDSFADGRFCRVSLVLDSNFLKKSSASELMLMILWITMLYCALCSMDGNDPNICERHAISYHIICVLFFSNISFLCPPSRMSTVATILIFLAIMIGGIAYFVKHVNDKRAELVPPKKPMSKVRSLGCLPTVNFLL